MAFNAVPGMGWAAPRASGVETALPAEPVAAASEAEALVTGMGDLVSSKTCLHTKVVVEAREELPPVQHGRHAA
ncbi:hypothetical protein [Methylobacterium sp. B4]|uniref:hypothetical protein n=1 Tax=Methylobacterium sp. B4 TaxID=1938755 RepID=UPI0015E8BAF1|nr:hypothetical protein [Methylobacterium sp. B4]